MHIFFRFFLVLVDILFFWKMARFFFVGRIFGVSGAQAGLKGSGAENFQQKSNWDGVPRKPRLELSLCYSSQWKDGKRESRLTR